MIRHDTQVNAINSGLFAWWRAELGGIFRAQKPRNGTHARRRFVASIDAQNVRWIEERDQGLRRIGLETPTADPTVATLEILMRAQRRRRAVPLGIRLSKSDCLERRVTLPTAARDDWGRILALDIERATPFKRADVYSAFIEDTSAAAQKGKTALRHLIVKRALIDAPVAALKAHDLDVSFADCWDETGERALRLDFLGSAPEATPTQPAASSATRMMAIMALVLTGTAAYLTIDKHQAALGVLDSQILAAKTRAQALRQDIDKSHAALSVAQALGQIKNGTTAPAAVIDELTRLLPDDTYLTDLHIADGKISIAGLSAKAVALVGLIDASDMFLGVELTAPVLFDQNANKEQFRIEARLSANNSSSNSLAPASKPVPTKARAEAEPDTTPPPEPLVTAHEEATGNKITVEAP